MATPAQTQAMTLADNKKKILQFVNNDKFKEQLRAALIGRLPEDFALRTALSLINSNTDLQECEPITVAASILLLAQAGLAPEQWKGQGYLIPRKLKFKDKDGKESYRLCCTALIGYKGYIKLAYDCKEVAKPGAHCVYEGDEFDIDLGSGLMPTHKPWIKMTPERPKRGEILGAYAYVKLKNGECIVDWMTKEDIDAVRARSAAGKSGPWATDYAEMARKTPFRRLAKWIPDADLQTIAAQEEAQDFGRMESVIDNDTGEIVTRYIQDDAPEQEEKKPPVPQPQRVQQQPTGQPQTNASEKTGQPEKSAQTEQKAQPESNAQAETNATTAQAEESKSETPAEPGAKETVYETIKEPPPVDAYDKTNNPQGKHISRAMVSRLFAIRGATAKGNNGAPTEEALYAYVQSLGDYPSPAHLPHGNRDLYDKVCAWAGGDFLKVKA